MTAKSTNLKDDLHLVGRVKKFFQQQGTDTGFKSEDFKTEAVVLAIGSKNEKPGLLLFMKEGPVESCRRALQKYKQESGKEKLVFYRNGRCTLSFEPGIQKITVENSIQDPVCKEEIHSVLSAIFSEFEIEYEEEGFYKEPTETMQKSGTPC